MFHLGFKSTLSFSDLQGCDSAYNTRYCMWCSAQCMIMCVYVVFLAFILSKTTPLSCSWENQNRLAKETKQGSTARSKDFLKQLDDLHYGSVDPISFLICKLLFGILNACRNEVCSSFRHLATPVSVPDDGPAKLNGSVQRGDSPPKRQSKARAVPKSFYVHSIDDGMSNTRESGYATESRNYIQPEGYKIPGYFNTVTKHTDVSGVACSTMGSSSYVSGSRDYSQSTYKSKIVGAGNVTLIKPIDLFGIESEPDKKTSVAKQQTIEGNANSMARTSGYNSGSTHSIRTDTNIGTDKLMCDTTQAHHKDLNGYQPRKDKPTKSSVQPTMMPATKQGYNKPTYAVLVGNSVKVYSTSIFASLPTRSTFMVKERQKDSSGMTRVKLALKSCVDQRYCAQLFGIITNEVIYVDCETITLCKVMGQSLGNPCILRTYHFCS